GGEVDRVAERRIFEALLRAEIADAGLPRMDADAEADRRIGQGADGTRDVEGGEAAVERVARILERGVPERHHAVADIFVDRAVVIEDGPARRRVDGPDERDDAFRRARFGEAGEVPHIGEQDRQRAYLAAEGDPLRFLDEPLDDRRRDEAAEYAA